MMRLIIVLIFTNLAYGSDFFKGKSSLEDPFSLRDPFSRVDKGIDKQEPKGYQQTKKGVYTNLNESSDLSSLTLDKLVITGIIFGEKRRAFAKIKGQANKTFTLKEGLIVGKGGAELKAILPNGIILVEKLINVYGEEEYLETVIPITR